MFNEFVGGDGLATGQTSILLSSEEFNQSFDSLMKHSVFRQIIDA
jgi:hypothetical protein